MWRPARLADTSCAIGRSFSSGTLNSSATSVTWFLALTGALVFCTQRAGALPFARHMRRPVQLTNSVGNALLIMS